MNANNALYNAEIEASLTEHGYSVYVFRVVNRDVYFNVTKPDSWIWELEENADELELIAEIGGTKND